MDLTGSDRLALGACALGRAIDSNGLPLDRGPRLAGRGVPVQPRLPSPSERIPIDTPLWTGVRVLDGLLTIGRGARIGIFGAPGAGKTTLIESIASGCEADATVVALVGERGREAQRWIERRDAGMTVICATSDRPARDRVRAAHAAFAHAGALRERGLHVLVVLDSLARFAAALREIAVAAGESAGRGGYPPSVFAEMARLVEAAGAFERGSITVIASVIHDGDERDPVSEAARSLLDGHTELSSRLAETGRFPAVSVPASASRTMDSVVGKAHLRAAAIVRRALALLDRIDDARSLGIEPEGRAERLAILAENRLEAFLRQTRCAAAHDATLASLLELAALLEDGTVLNSETSR
jgi:type III secretion protein N (ATPase)